jgi:hypothetical protein
MYDFRGALRQTPNRTAGTTRMTILADCMLAPAGVHYRRPAIEIPRRSSTVGVCSWPL